MVTFKYFLRNCGWLLVIGLSLLVWTAGCKPGTPVQAKAIDPSDTLGIRLHACQYLTDSAKGINTYRNYFENQPVLDQENRFQITKAADSHLFLVRELFNRYQPEDKSFTEFYLGEWTINTEDSTKLYPFFDLQLVEKADTAYYTNREEGLLQLKKHWKTQLAGKTWNLYQVWIYDPEEWDYETPTEAEKQVPTQIVTWSPEFGTLRVFFGKGNYFDLIESSLCPDPKVLEALKKLIDQ